MTPSSAPDPLLTLWQSQPEPVAASFGPRPEAPAGVVWQLDLPAGMEAARAQLDAIRATIRLAEEANAQAPDRLQALAASQTGPTAFAAPTLSLPLPEQELLALIQPPPEAVSFAWGPPGDWEQVAEELREFLQGVRRFVAHYAWVETKVRGVLVARTEVAWSGDFQTAWEQPLPSGAEALHKRSLQLALASRTALLRTTAVILSGAVLILPMVTNPAGVVIALPAVWRFIQRLRKELETGRLGSQ